MKVTVTKVERGKDKFGDRYFERKAQGEYVLVDLEVKNIGKTPVAVMSSTFTLHAADGTVYSGSDDDIYRDDPTIFEDVKPGNTLKGQILFDIPKGAEFSTLEIDGALFADPGIVNLG